MHMVLPLHEHWYIIDGNRQDSPDFHLNGIPREHAAEACVPCYTHMVIPDHVGVSWYETEFALDHLPDARERAILRFEQASFRTEVSLNGRMAGEHTGVEDPFFFDVTDLLKTGMNRLTVRVSRPYEQDVDGMSLSSIPHRNQTPSGLKPGWCYNVSGVCGEVQLEILPDVRIEELQIVPDAQTGGISVRMTVISALPCAQKLPVRCSVRLSPAGETEDEQTASFTIQPGENSVSLTLHVSHPRLWDVNDPNLYLVRADIGTHSAQCKTGFRTFRVTDDGWFELNGRRILLRSSHTGNCMPESTQHISRDPQLLRKDFLMAKAAGFNMIRFISGAALPLQLDLCDEIGLMIYEEPTGGWRTENGLHAAEMYMHNLLSMVKRDRNHPCLTVWGLLNETYAKEPYDEVCFAAMNALPALRDLDETRLVLFSSGRWDRHPEVGSLANPGQRSWQCLWGHEGEAGYEGEDLGDIHYYPGSVPLDEKSCARMRSFGMDGVRPVFVSESGVGSALDTISAVRYFDRPDAIAFAPDLQMYRRMNDAMMEDFARYGFAMAFPSQLMLGSMKNHAYYREQAFDQLRANPRVCGISLTGLLDHSICGEGLWTIWRSFKPQIADVLQDGFAPLRWCLFPHAPAIFEGEKLRVEAVLANEDQLTAGRTYHICAGIIGPDGETGVRRYEITPAEEQMRVMTLPVFDEEWDTAGLPAGEYTFRTDLLNGGLATCGVKTFHVVPRPVSRTGRRVLPVGLSETRQNVLKALGYALISEWEPGCAVVSGEVNAETAQQLNALLQRGAFVLAACAAFPEDESELILPEERRPAVLRHLDWLYHRETVLRPGGRFFTGMRTGLADALLYTNIITKTHYEARGAQIPDETDAMAFCPGYCIDAGYHGGFKLASYRVGGGTLVMNTFNLLDEAHRTPYAARMLVNILDCPG